jgi:hypothetical protein
VRTFNSDYRSYWFQWGEKSLSGPIQLTTIPDFSSDPG